MWTLYIIHRDCIHVLISAMSLRWKGMEGGQVYMVNLYLAKPSPVRRRQGSNWCIGLTTSQWIIIWWADADGFETVSIFRVERTDVGSCFDSCQWIYIWPVTWSDIFRLIGMNPGNNRDWLQVGGNCLVLSSIRAICLRSVRLYCFWHDCCHVRPVERCLSLSGGNRAPWSNIGCCVRYILLSNFFAFPIFSTAQFRTSFSESS